MKALLIRHAHAVDGGGGPGANGDFSRWLSAKGRTVARKVGKRLHDDGIIPDVIVSSPLPRALQTAELVAAALGFRGVVEILPELAPDESISGAVEALARLSGELVAVVGHEPNISALAAELAGKAVGAFRKGQAMLVVYGNGDAEGKIGYRLDPDTL